MMTGFVTIYLILVLVSIDVISCCPSGIYLTSSKTIVEENTTVTLACNYKPGTTTIEVVWESSMYQSGARFARSGDTCICDGYLYDTINYECKCDTDGQLSVVVKNVNRAYNGAKWSCRAQVSNPCNWIILNVSVPIRKMEIRANDIGPINENSTTTFFCSTFSLPAADISWSITNGTVVKMLSNNNQVNITRRETIRSDKLIKVNETLTYRVDRHVHGWKISCNASTLKGSTVPAIALHLYVVYPPDNPPKIYSFINESTFSVIEGRTENLSCSVEGGNPPGLPIWTCMDKNNTLIHKKEYDKIPDRIATLNLTFTAMRSQVDKCVCKTDHKLSNEFVYVAINVLYEAIINSFYTNPSHTVINENQTYEFICEVDSNPGATITIEMPNGETFMVRSSYRLKHNYTITSCLDIGRYTCTAVNENAKGHVNRNKKDLLVNCVPIPFSKPKIEVQSSLHTPATLTFITIAYPKPTCSWKIWNETCWSDISENMQQHSVVATSNISSSNTLHIFQCNLTITHFTKWKREEFQLRVKNVVGEYIQNFTLKPRVVDNKPKSTTSFATIAGGLVGVLIVVSAALLTLWIIRKRIRVTPAKEVYQNVHLHGNGNVYDRVTPLQDRTDIEIKELTYEYLAANGNYDNPTYINLQL